MNQLLKKKIVALTGLGLILFVCVHLSGNFLLFCGPEAYNSYAAKLHSLPFSGLLEWGLFFTFVVHMFFTFNLVLTSRSARKVSYAIVGPEGFIARTMKWSGSVVLVFLVFHLMDYAFATPTLLQTTIDGSDMGLYGLVVNSYLMSPYRVLGYVFSVFFVGLHVSHGAHSFFQTMGFFRLYRFMKDYYVSLILGCCIFLGYASIPIYVLVLYGGFR